MSSSISGTTGTGQEFRIVYGNRYKVSYYSPEARNGFGACQWGIGTFVDADSAGDSRGSRFYFEREDGSVFRVLRADLDEIRHAADSVTLTFPMGSRGNVTIQGVGPAIVGIPAKPGGPRILPNIS